MNHGRHHHPTGSEVAGFVLPLLRGEKVPAVGEEDAERLAEGIRVAGLTALALRRLNGSTVPSSLRESLERERNLQRADLAFLFDRLGRFSAMLEEVEVPFIVLKGGSLAPLIYDSPELRPMVDIDVLIRRESWPRAREAMVREGYGLPGSRDERYWLENYFNMPVSTPGPRKASFDIHWALNQEIRFQVDEEGLWERAVPVENHGLSYLRLGNEDLLLSLLLHIAHHYFEARLVWLYDIKLLIEKLPMDWALFSSRARRWGMATVCRLGLEFVGKVFPGSVPGAAVEELRIGAVRRALLAPLRSQAPTRLFLGDNRRLWQLVQGILVLDSPWVALRFGMDKIARRIRFLGSRPRLR